MKDRNNRSLLVAIDEFRKWNVEPRDLNWQTLMFFFEDACREYALDKLYEQWFSDGLVFIFLLYYNHGWENDIKTEAIRASEITSSYR